MYLLELLLLLQYAAAFNVGLIVLTCSNWKYIRKQYVENGQIGSSESG